MSGAPPAGSIRRLDFDRTAEAVASDTALATANLLNGASRVSVSFDASPQTRSIAHKLGRVPRGWIVTRQLFAPTLVREVSSDANYLTLENLGAASSAAELVVF